MLYNNQSSLKYIYYIIIITKGRGGGGGSLLVGKKRQNIICIFIGILSLFNSLFKNLTTCQFVPENS